MTASGIISFEKSLPELAASKAWNFLKFGFIRDTGLITTGLSVKRPRIDEDLLCLWMQFLSQWLMDLVYLFIINDNISKVNSGWNREVDGQIIHPTENFISMNLLQMFCVITFLTSEVMEALVRPKTILKAWKSGFFEKRN